MNTNFDLTATHTAAFRSVRVDFLNSGEIQFVVAGEVTETELETILAAGGADVAGFSCDLS